MGKEEKRALPPDWVQRKLMALRQQLEHGSAPPEAAAALALLKLVTSSQTEAPFTLEKEDETMLSVILSDALEGVDIASRYPVFFTRLMTEPALSAVFLDALDMLELPLQEGDDLAPVAVELSFLNETKASPQLRHTGEGRRQVIWQLFHDRLSREFFSPPDLVYRSGGRSLLEDESFILIEDTIQLDQLTLNVMLEAIQPMTEPGWLRLQLNTAAQTHPLPPLEATIKWGDFSATATPDQFGFAAFPMLALETIGDPAEMLVFSDLQLVLEFPPT